MTASVKEQLLLLTVAVETALSASDYRAYRRYVEPGASFFEPRSRGALMQVCCHCVFHGSLLCLSSLDALKQRCKNVEIKKLE